MLSQSKEIIRIQLIPESFARIIEVYKHFMYLDDFSLIDEAMNSLKEEMVKDLAESVLSTSTTVDRTYDNLDTVK